jgi:hypothetical protein
MVIELVLNGRQDEIGYIFFIGLPQTILPLVAVTTMFHILVVRSRLRLFRNLITRTTAGLALFLFAVLFLSLVDEFPPKDDLIFILVFFQSMVVSYYLVEILIYKRSEQRVQ